ncbi:MAG: endolytic transglycosylase MltG [Prevotella sp.]|nr:endolytic transglycosylase MltG [Prevotella sp.]
MTNIIKRHYLITAAVCGGIIVVLALYHFLAPISKAEETHYLYIDADDTPDSVCHKLTPIANQHALSGLMTLLRHSNYAENMHTGRYEVTTSINGFGLFRNLKNGRQTPLMLTIPSVRTTDRLAAELSRKLMLDSAEIADALADTSVCQKYDLDTATIISMFIPNTYEMYWNIGLESFLNRMKKESDTFWNAERQQKAEKAGLTREVVVTLASIIDEETANNGEKPMIAGMYINRLRQKMPLQADPTVKFAMKKFELRRIYNKQLAFDSPYNTYRNVGLPPGPIRIPSVAGIDAVLNHKQHNYLYMCAKEDFSGTHNFAATYAEHLQNAMRYSRALNERGIK